MLVGTARKRSTFEWYVSSSDDLTELKGRHEATGTGGPEDQLGNADLLRHCSCEDHQVVGYDAGNAGHVGGGVELQQKLRKRGRTVPLYREPQLDQPIRASVIRLRHAVRNGHEPEGGNTWHVGRPQDPVCTRARLLVAESSNNGLSAAVLLRQQPLVLEYHRGRLLEGNYTVNLLFYGRFSPSQRSIVADFFRSLSPVYPSLPPPSPASWWHTTSLYGGGGPVRLYLGPQILDEGYSRGKRLCAWPFHRPLYGPQKPPLVPPNGDMGMDGAVINLAALLAGAVTNPDGRGYFQGPASAPLEAVTACSGAYPGYPGGPGGPRHWGQLQREGIGREEVPVAGHVGPHDI
ncbi:hypothetical protein BHE74_00039130 [Ensete ventricosum]|nr:hypothetical protein BHE74_00039130 [Ensete ventricosum]